MFPKDWTTPCGSYCTKKYAGLVQIPWRIFCKKGCNSDRDNWDECREECSGICFKDPVLKDRDWSSYIDRSPGSDDHSMACFRACISGCGYKFDILEETVEKMQPNRQPKLPSEPTLPHCEPEKAASNELPCTSA